MQKNNQQPEYKDLNLLATKKAKLKAVSHKKPIACVDTTKELANSLNQIKQGHGYAIIAGPCAETLGQVIHCDYATNLYKNIHRASQKISGMIDEPVTMIARAGVQMAKPRSKKTEILPCGKEVPSYQGDMINSSSPDLRDAQPVFLLAAYQAGLMMMDDINQLSEAYDQTLYVSSEAMLLPFEESVTHNGYNHSGHMKWIGNRTNNPDDEHIDLMAQTQNPMGVKIGPDMEVEKLKAILEKGKPDMLIFRMAENSKEKLGQLLDCLVDLDDTPVLCCDAMHGNTYEFQGKKTRHVETIKKTTTEFIEAVRERGLHPGAFMYEIASSSNVQECIGGNVDESNFANNYESLCDPTLNNSQFEEIVARLADDLTLHIPNKNSKNKPQSQKEFAHAPAWS